MGLEGYQAVWSEGLEKFMGAGSLGLPLLLAASCETHNVAQEAAERVQDWWSTPETLNVGEKSIWYGEIQQVDLRIDGLGLIGTSYVAPVRAVSGRSRDGIRCLSEIETLPHILGFCPYSEALRNIRHHAVRSMMAEALKEVEFTVHQEVQGLATQGSVRRIDIIAIKNSAYILDLTIRFETHADQPHEVDSEKKRIYEPKIPFYNDKYSLSHIDVIGLIVGARGTIPSFFANKCKNLGLTHSIVKEIAISALKG
ncbi:hypothetical protein ANN_08112 [Periplaneta americana]|uniref:Uncharacterized protein n=1 Tax=Periplaneta americana TaxID=6978 RepID=A0ABQ8T1W7_PERAM|nr:hypothetical protein ANN_08112 [Periplaneta americana]